MSFDVFENIFTASDPAGGRAIKVSALAGIDNAESYYTQNDPAGGRAIKVKIIAGGASTGTLQVEGGVALDATLRNITDTSVTPVASTLYMSTETVAIIPTNISTNENMLLIDSNNNSIINPFIRMNVNSARAALIRFSYGVSPYTNIGDFRADSANGIAFNASGSYPITFYVNEVGKKAMRIQSAGNVTIGYGLNVTSGDIDGSNTTVFAVTSTGVSTISASSLGTTSTSYLTLINTTAATSTVRQNSPALSLTGSGWNGSAGVDTGFKMYSNIFSSSSYELKFTTAGNADVLTLGTTQLSMIGSISATGTFILGSNAIISAPSSAVVRLRNGSAGPLNRLELGDATQGARLILNTGDGIPGFTTVTGTNVQRLTFGPSGTAAPALAPVTTSTTGDTLKAVFADGTGDVFIMGKHKTHAAYVNTTVTPTGYLVVFDSTGTSYRIPAVAGA
jgi:hypothetical protein